MFLHFSGLGLVSLGPSHCAYIHLCLCVISRVFCAAYMLYYCNMVE